jgi:hypothetical protein
MQKDLLFATGLTERDYGDIAKAMTGSMSSEAAQEVSQHALTQATLKLGDDESGAENSKNSEVQILANKLLESSKSAGGSKSGGRGKERNAVVNALADVMSSRSMAEIESLFSSSDTCRRSAINALSRELMAANTPHQQRDLVRLLTGGSGSGNGGSIKQSAAFLAAVLGDVQMQAGTSSSYPHRPIIG